MRVVSWNVNGFRAVLKNSRKRLEAFLDALDADIICLQETKVAKEQLDDVVCIADGYTSFFSCCSTRGGYSGVATFCRGVATPVRAEEGLTGVLTPPTLEDVVGHYTPTIHTPFSQEEMWSIDREGRAILTEHLCHRVGKGVRSEGVRSEGVEDEGVEGVRSEGVEDEGVEGDGGRSNSMKDEGVMADGVKGEDVKVKGVRGEGVKGECEKGVGVKVKGVRGEGVRLVVVNVYCPMVDRENVRAGRLDYKLLFYSALRQRCLALEQLGRVVVVAGDLNCSREAIDSAYILDDPTLLNASPEREWMKTFVVTHPPTSTSFSSTSTTSTTTSSSTSSTTTSSSLLLDTFRCLHPSQPDAYTCWSTVLDCRKNNYGTRIDYVLCSLRLSCALTSAEVWAEVRGSDHCPIVAEFAGLRLVPSPRCPSISSVRRLGRQAKLSAFMASRATVEGEVTVQRGEGGGGARGIAGSVFKRRLSGGQSTAKRRKTQKTSTLLSFFTSHSTPSNSDSKGVWPAQSRDLPRPQHAPSTSPPVTSTTNTVSVDTVAMDTVTMDTITTNTVSMDTVATDAISMDTVTMAPSRSQLTGQWRALLPGPPQPPLCVRHGEPCTLRTVRRAGPNQNQQFWSCARPGGRHGDPAAKCNFFQWVK